MTAPIGYRPGDRWLVCGRSALVFIDGDAATALAAWPLVRREASAAELYEQLVHARRDGDVAVLVQEPTGLRILVRGDVPVDVTTVSGGRVLVAADGLLTWRELVVSDATTVRLGEAGSAGEAELLPVPTGVVPAGFVRWELPDAALGAGTPPETPPEVDAAASAHGPADKPAHGPAGKPADPSVADSADPQPVDDPATGDDAITVISTVPPADERSGPASAPGFEPPRARAGEVTQSVPLDDEEEHVLPATGADADRADGSASDQAADGIVDGVADGFGEAPAAAPRHEYGDPDRITELAESLPADYTPPPLTPAAPSGWVYASMCPSGHANQPYAGNCRTCGQPIPAAEPVAAPRPLLGRIRLSTGPLVDLDRRVVIGRAPTVSRVSSSELPQLITVPSPHQDISRSHVEIRAEDWHLVVADMHSTNGTVVRPPDRPEQLLHPGQELVVEPGWTVDLGDGITFVVEAAG